MDLYNGELFKKRVFKKLNVNTLNFTGMGWKVVNWLGAMSPKTIENLTISEGCSWKKALLVWCTHWMALAGNAEAVGNTVVMFTIPLKDQGIYLKEIDELIERMKYEQNKDIACKT